MQVFSWSRIFKKIKIKKELGMFLLLRGRGSHNHFCQDTSKFFRHHHILIKWSSCSSSPDPEYYCPWENFLKCCRHEGLRGSILLTFNKTVSIEPDKWKNYSEIRSVWNKSLWISLCCLCTCSYPTASSSGRGGESFSHNSFSIKSQTSSHFPQSSDPVHWQLVGSSGRSSHMLNTLSNK